MKECVISNAQWRKYSRAMQASLENGSQEYVHVKCVVTKKRLSKK